MAEAARSLGHQWIALTDHSPRLTVANGLSASRLEAQLELVAALNEELAPFRVLTGIEVDILEDGALDQREDLLRRLDVVVASVHSQLRMPSGPMTRRMVAAVRDPHVTVLGHCTGRLLGGGRGRRPESAFDPEAVFGACREAGVAVEINCRPERRDPPGRLLRLAAEAGCLFAMDSDAHAPGQLDWLANGTVRAEEAGITATGSLTRAPPPSWQAHEPGGACTSRAARAPGRAGWRQQDRGPGPPQTQAAIRSRSGSPQCRAAWYGSARYGSPRYYDGTIYHIEAL
jgi:histidinol phosphatase-like PHP family hydrolase